MIAPLDTLDFTAIIRRGDTIAWPQAIGEPLGLTARLLAQRASLPRARLFFGMSSSRTLTPELAEHFDLVALNGAGSNRRVSGVAEIIPAFVSAIPRLLRSGALPVDVALIRVRLRPDGSVTTGCIADTTQAMVAAARCVIAEVDDRLPMTGHDAILPAGTIHHFVTAGPDEALMPDPVPSDVEARVAAHVAALIPNGATVQLGIGTMSVAVAAALHGHHGLGVHGGVVSDSYVALAASGAVTNAMKGIDAGLTVTGGLFGTHILSDHADGNPAIALRSADHTHSLAVMAQIHALHSINSALEIDTTGQVNAEAIGGRYLGAVGGYADFIRGAQVSPGGRSIIALPSTTADGTQSRIVARLSGPVTAARGDVDVVVTEFGVADLRGCTLSERSCRLVAIAHPDFRADLRACARKAA